jgi:hypothetical protein
MGSDDQVTYSAPLLDEFVFEAVSPKDGPAECRESTTESAPSFEFVLDAVPAPEGRTP